MLAEVALEVGVLDAARAKERKKNRARGRQYSSTAARDGREADGTGRRVRVCLLPTVLLGKTCMRWWRHSQAMCEQLARLDGCRRAPGGRSRWHLSMYLRTTLMADITTAVLAC